MDHSNNQDHDVAVDFYGCVGKKDGVWTRERMIDWGLNGDSILLLDAPTGRAIIQVADDGENSIVLFPGANHALYHDSQSAHSGLPTTSKSFSSQVLPKPNFTHLLLQNEIDFGSTLSAIAQAKATRDVGPADRTSPKVIWNPSPSPTRSQFQRLTDADAWRNIDWLIVNKGEAEDILDSFTELAIRNGMTNQAQQSFDAVRVAGQPMEQTLKQLADIPVLRSVNIICTLGADGLLAHLPSYPTNSAPASVQHHGFLKLSAGRLISKVVDTTGAGDCFTGYFVCGLMEVEAEVEAKVKAEGGRDKPDIASMIWVLQLAAQAATMCVEKQGTIDSIPLREEVDERLKGSIAP